MKPEELWQHYAKSRREEDRDELIVQYLPLVKFVVGRVAAGLPDYIKLDDLYSSGVTGLIKAVEKFDTSKNNKFETYAIFLIRGAIIDELRALDWIPRSVHQKANLISGAQTALQQQLGRDPTDEELSNHLGLSEEEFGEWLSRIRPAILIPLNAEVASDEDNTPLSDRIPDQRVETGLEFAHRKEYQDILAKAIEDLPDQEKRVLTLYYFEELMLKEIGKVMGVTESRVSQIHSKALLKLRTRLKSLKEEYNS